VKAPLKKRRRKGSKAAAPKARELMADYEDVSSSYAGFTSPFLWDNGTVLAYPPIRTVLLLKRRAGTPRSIENAAALRADVVSFFGEAVFSAHGDGSQEQSRKAPGVTLLKSGDVGAIEAFSGEHAWGGVHAFNKKAAQGGLLYDRAWLRLQRQLAANRTLARSHTEAMAQDKGVQGGLHAILRRDGSAFVPSITALPAVARRVTVVEVDAGDLSLSAALRLFMMADVVLGVHGAALANTLFSPPTTSVVEVALHQGSCRQYAALGAAMGLDYWTHLTPHAETYASALPGSAHVTHAVDRAAAEAEGLSEHMWGTLRDDPAPIRPGPYSSPISLRTGPLRCTMAAMLAKRMQANAQAAGRAQAGREQLLLRGVLPTDYQRRPPAPPAGGAGAGTAP
jgi:hypothetical protein